MKGEELAKMSAELRGEWSVVDEHHLERRWKFKDFREALEFTNKVGALAETVGHHPTITLAWGRVTLKVFTQKIDGLSESDFVFAAKVNEMM
jgi:4a-hydroxytetrahydrobiopterin dehydratase